MRPTETHLIEFLKSKDMTFFIPPFQRNYEWEREQCQILWDDIINVFEQNSKKGSSYGVEHFFGTVTYFQDDGPSWEPSRFVLIDGQQRITTTMLFLSALRDTISDERKKRHIDDNWLKNPKAENTDSEFKVKLKQVEADAKTYSKIIMREVFDSNDRTSACYQNYQFFLEKIGDFTRSCIDPMLLVDEALAKFSVILVELEPKKNSWERPQEIFESMNSIGKPLSLADLVRNRLLLGFDASRQEELYRKYWLDMEETIPRMTSAFIRDYMQMTERHYFPIASDANHKRLYSAFKSIYTSASDKLFAEKLLKDLSQYAKVYAMVALRDKSTGDAKIDLHLEDFQRLEMTTARPFLMALLWAWKGKKFSDKELDDILCAFKIYGMRRRLIVGLTSAENKNFPQYVAFIPELEKAKNKKERLFELLSIRESTARLPNDLELTTELKSMANFYSFKQSRFYLALVEEALTKTRPSLSDGITQVEHIMPQTPTKKWKEEFGAAAEKYEQYVNSIGNLTLIRHNSELGNKPFEEKKKVYSENESLQIARTMIVDKPRWDVGAIEARADWIIKCLLDKVLPIPTKMRTTRNFVVKDQSKGTDGKKNGLSFAELDLIDKEITFKYDESITARVVDDNHVEFEGRVMLMSPLTKLIMERLGKANKSGAYQGAQYWKYGDTLLADMM